MFKIVKSKGKKSAYMYDHPGKNWDNQTQSMVLVKEHHAHRYNSMK